MTEPTGAELTGCGANEVIAQATSDATTPYAVPGPGTITRWGTNASQSNPGSAVTLVVLKPVGSSFVVAGTDTRAIPEVPLGSILSFKLARPINVGGGETLGLYTGQAGEVVCFFSGGQTPAGGTLAALGAASSPTGGQTLARVGGDSPPGFTMNLDATFVPGSASRKCKRKRHKKHAAEQAKKRCKKKRRKG